MQRTLFPIEITHQFPSSGTTADLRHVGVGSDSHQYALKTLSDSPLLPISEWVGHHLCQSLKIATPDFAIVKIFDGSLAFGSRWDLSAMQYPKNGGPFDIAQFFSDVKHEVSAIYAMDLFLPNDDRHGRNFLFRTGPSGKVPLAFDFSRAWVMLGLPFGSSLEPDCNTLVWWQYLKRTCGYVPANHIFQEILNLPDTWLEQVLANAPTTWTDGFDSSKSIDFWTNQRSERCKYAESML